MHARTTAIAVVALAVVALTVPLAGPAAAAPPPNDDRAGAVPIRSVPFSQTLSTDEATASPDDPTGCGVLGSTVWYTLRLAESQWLEIDTYDSSYDTDVGIFTRSGGTFTTVDCGAAAYGPAAWFTFRAKADTTYYVMVGACCEHYGGTLVIDVGPGPRDLRGDVSVDDGVVDPDGQVTLSGTARCTVAAGIQLFITVRQVRDGAEVVTGLEARTGCSPEGFRWSETMWGSTGFVRGPAEVHVDWYVTNYFSSDAGLVDTHVRLRPTAAAP